MASSRAAAGRPSADSLLERSAELSAIEALTTATASGVGGALFVRGPAGIGKTSLLAAARSQAESLKLRVLKARGGLMERDYPFGVVRQLLEHVVADQSLRPAVLAGPAVAAASVFDADSDFQTPDLTFAVTYGLFWALMNLAALCPLLLTVDDLQWADDQSLRTLDFVLRRIEDAPIGIVLGVRSGEDLGPPGDGMLAELEAAGLLRGIEPAPLSEQSAAVLASHAFDDPVDADFASACHARSAGNPLFLTELLRGLADDGVPPTTASVSAVERSAPRGINRVLQARLARFGADEKALARTIAVLGDQGRLVDAAEVAGLTAEQASRATDRLVAAGLVHRDGLLRFEHPLMRDAVLADTATEVIAAMHKAAADVLVKHGRDAEVVAAQTLLSPPAGNAESVDRLQNAARQALARSAPEEAARLLSRAIAEPPTPEQRPAVLFELGAAEAAMRNPQAGPHLGEALALAPPGAMRAQVALLLARLLAFAGHTSQVHATVELGQAGLSADDQDLLLALDAVALTSGALTPSGPMLTAEGLERYRQLSGQTPGERAVLACVAFTLGRSGHPVAEVRDLAERALAHGGGHLSAGSDPFTALMLNVTLQWCGDLTRAIALGTEALEEARSINSSMLYTEVLASRAWAYWANGDLDQAEADARLSFETEGMIAGGRSPVAVASLTRILVERGRHAEAHALASGFELPEDREDLMVREFIATALGRVELAMGNHAAALRHLDEAGEISSRSGVRNAVVSEWRLHAAEALRGLGRYDDAAATLAPALEHARRSGGAAELGGSLRVAALIEPTVNIELLKQAIDVFAPSERHLDHARTLVELGAALRRSGARDACRQPLSDGVALAQRCGAHGLVERGMSELRATGARPRRVERTGIAALTPSERRVASLAAGGHSNRSIAQELFVSTRTVETHLRGAFEKLGVHSRQELAPLFADEGPTSA
jgi:DNA-binding CsgD family transcriptional regulator